MFANKKLEVSVDMIYIQNYLSFLVPDVKILMKTCQAINCWRKTREINVRRKITAPASF